METEGDGGQRVHDVVQRLNGHAVQRVAPSLPSQGGMSQVQGRGIVGEEREREAVGQMESGREDTHDATETETEGDVKIELHNLSDLPLCRREKPGATTPVSLESVMGQLTEIDKRGRETFSRLKEKEKMLVSLTRQYGEQGERLEKLEAECDSLRTELQEAREKYFRLHKMYRDLSPAYSAAKDSEREAVAEATRMREENRVLREREAQSAIGLAVAGDREVLLQREADALAALERERHTVARLLLDQLSSGKLDLSLLEMYVERYGDICDEGETYTPQSEEEESESEIIADRPQAWTEEQYQAFYQECPNRSLVDAVNMCIAYGGKRLRLNFALQAATLESSLGSGALQELEELRITGCP
ncbi:hypothetical protein KIPB_009975 [Kipferlia bialata]|uniref:Uncharacterized protein n=1 Tax=Kipferlia bialata TaxID=797122 RepID=A0A391NTX0_9EUKA|nr:hypothetical protein KIPB_009975 [Kipferlia bialata]|eukprot:g9975.t1